MTLRWTVSVTLHMEGRDETAAVGAVSRPVEGATPADFGLCLSEARSILSALQQQIAQSQIQAYDAHRRCCPHCGRYRQIKDWRQRVFLTSLGKIHVRVPRVRSCHCLPEPLDENGDSLDLRNAECSIERLLPGRMTPELNYLCAKQGASSPYRPAAQLVQALSGVNGLSHSSVRRSVIRTGEYIEDEQFKVGWRAYKRASPRAKRLNLAIDSTVISANAFEGVSKFEVIAGRIEHEGKMSRRFVCALSSRRTLTSMLVAAALKQSGWAASTLVDVVNDGAKGMRSLVADVVPRIATPVLDWFHIGMKLQAIRNPLEALTYDRGIERPLFMAACLSRWKELRELLWRGKADKAIELVGKLTNSIQEEHPRMSGFYANCAATAHGAAKRLYEYLTNNRSLLVNYHRARRSGRRISTAAAESVMNHLINRRLSKRQQMRWSMKGAHCVLLARVEMLDGRLEEQFRERYPHFRSPEIRAAGVP